MASRSAARNTPTSCSGWQRSRVGCAQELAQHERLALLGDFNIAPEARDVHDPVLWEGQILCSEPEREAFRTLLRWA
jgi:exonuclease III